MTSHASWLAEEAAINGFPPLRRLVVDGWLLRFSGSVRRTANSATPLRTRRGRIDPLIAAVERHYRAQEQPTIFRIPSFLPPAIDAELAARGYTGEGESCIIEGPLAPIIAAAAPFGGTEAVQLWPHPVPEWLAAMARLQGQAPEYRAIYKQIVGSVLLPAAFAMLAVDGEPVALAYGVVHYDRLCFESVVTADGYRRRGYSRRVLGALAAWSKDNGARIATLQVEASNTPGRTLYRAIGMTAELHRYHYRREPVR
ncbi:MAG TPA: GNAT family N-acetyltransferase [Stellaceae bacterium]|jgi:GNAT superfamily N-acetyltransferase|nr:GNAT family N-acetyltransferase [Stellaceae bacterium]